MNAKQIVVDALWMTVKSDPNLDHIKRGDDQAAVSALDSMGHVDWMIFMDDAIKAEFGSQAHLDGLEIQRWGAENKARPFGSVEAMTMYVEHFLEGLSDGSE